MAGLEQPLMLALAILVLPTLYIVVRREGRFSKLVGTSRTLIILLLAVAAASPFINAQESIMQEPEIVVLKDQSTSTQVLEDYNLEFDNMKVTERVIASGNQSNLKQGLLRNLDENKAYLVVSDFQSSESLDGVASEFRASNSTLNALRVDTEDEASVSIDGPSSTVPGAESRFTVNVHSTDDIPEPSVTLDGSPVTLVRQDNNTWSFTRSFSSQGSHSIKASIESNDRWSQNNQYFHAVDVTQKPEILVVGQQGSLGNQLEKFYDITYNNRIPDDLSDYYTVIMTEDQNSDNLAPYVTEGNGLIYTGDPTEDSTDLLPVKKVEKEQETDAAKLLLVIDISRSTAETGSVQRMKAVAYNLVEKLPYNTKVGILPYNTEAYRDDQVTDPIPLSNNRELLKSRIARLQPDGNSFHHVGLEGGRRTLNGTGNIILITDGRITDYGRNVNTEQKSKRTASNLGNVKLITVGAGPDRNKEFLRQIAELGNGHYLDAEQSNRLAFEFAAGGTEGESQSLVVTNPNHFVTEGLELDSSTDNFDSVEPKRGAKQLVATTNGDTFLTTWHYGLGRVAAFSGGNSQLDQVVTYDPLLISRSVAWSVGDPKRKQDQWIRVENSRRPETVEIRASYDIQGFKRQGDNLYTRELQPESLGFHSVNQQVYGYNYNRELQEVGYNDRMEDFVRSTGGNVYTPDQRQEIAEDIRTFSERKSMTKKSLSNYFILAALILFLSEVGYRKVNGKK